MLGHRGCRLGITHPSITEMQARAIVEAASEVQASGTPVHAEIMVPLVSMAAELAHQRAIIDGAIQRVKEHPALRVGTMIETPRAALTASEIAEHAEFFSFGTNDLTQTAFAFSRDDVGTFVPNYIEGGIMKDDPFQTLDVDGVGELMRLAIENGRTVRPTLRVGLCGEQGGDERSVHFCYKIGACPCPQQGLRDGRPPDAAAPRHCRLQLRVVLPVPRPRRAAGRGAGAPPVQEAVGRAMTHRTTAQCTLSRQGQLTPL